MALQEYILDPLGSAVSLSLATSGHLTLASASAGNLAPGSSDFMFAGWVYLASKAADCIIVAKYGNAGAFTDKRSYIASYSTSVDRFRFSISTTGTNATAVNINADNFGSPSINTWYYVEWGRVGGEMFIAVNRGTSNTVSVGAPFASTAAFTVGGFTSDGSTRFSGLNGRLGQLYYWHTTLPTTGERDTFYAAGDGLSRRAFVAAGIDTPYAAWEMEEATGNRVDWVGARNLSTSGTVSYAAGHPFDVDFTLLPVAILDADANKVQADEWQIQCYSGADICAGAGATVTGIATQASGPFKIQAASGHGHGGDFTAGAISTGIALSQAYSEVIGIRGTSGSAFTVSPSAAAAGIKLKKNLVENAYIYVTAYASALTDLEISNNVLKVLSAGTGLYLIVNGDGAAASLQGIVNNNTLVGTTSTSGIEMSCSEGSHSESLDLELLGNIAIGFTNGISYSASFDTEVVDNRSNVTSDLSGEITGATLVGTFVDAAGGDYETLVGGTAYRVGVASDVTDDLLGRARHTPPDAGAFEVPTPAALATDVSGPFNFGTLDVDAVEPTQVFNISNSGEVNLTGVDVVVPTGYEIVQDLPATIEPAASFPLEIRLLTDTFGIFSGNVAISANEDSLDIAVSGVIASGDAGLYGSLRLYQFGGLY